MRLQALQVGRARAGVSQEGAAPGLRLGVGGRCDLGAGSRWTAPLPLSPHPAQKQPPRRGAPPTATCRDAPSLPASSHGLTLAARKVMPQLDSTFRRPGSAPSQTEVWAAPCRAATRTTGARPQARASGGRATWLRPAGLTWGEGRSRAGGGGLAGWPLSQLSALPLLSGSPPSPAPPSACQAPRLLR